MTDACYPRRTRDVDTLVAYHEAGHVVACLALGGRVAAVTADPTPERGWLGHAATAAGGGFADLVVNEAGAIAERLSGVAPPAGWDAGRGDAEHSRRVNPDPTEHVRAFGVAYRLLHANDAAVHFLAHELRAVRAMTGARVAAFLRECRLTLANPTRS